MKDLRTRQEALFSVALALLFLLSAPLEAQYKRGHFAVGLLGGVRQSASAGLTSFGNQTLDVAMRLRVHTLLAFEAQLSRDMQASASTVEAGMENVARLQLMLTPMARSRFMPLIYAGAESSARTHLVAGLAMETMLTPRLAMLSAADYSAPMRAGRSAPRMGYVHARAGLVYHFRGDADHDRDGIYNRRDQAPNQREDFDGFQDDDGIPDPDNDRDLIPDIYDLAPNQPEDFDDFEDTDGKPDPDNDGDGFPDTSDAAPNAAEDFDGFEDHDGKPEWDNDADGLPDSLDQAPLQPEDLDGFEDHDGIPDPDNDGDAIPDSVDLAPNAAETLNGYQDEDGAPDVRPWLVIGEKIEINNVRFRRKSSRLRYRRFAELDSLAAQLVAQEEMEFEIQVSTNGSLRLALARANRLRIYLIAKGVSPQLLMATAYGRTTARGRSPFAMVRIR